METSLLDLPVAGGTLPGDLVVPDRSTGIVLFAHGSGSSRTSPRNRQVARSLQDAGLATLLFDLLNPHEERLDRLNGAFRFDIALLARRLVEVTRLIMTGAAGRPLRPAYFGASTGAAAALVAAAELPGDVRAVVSRGGRPDLAGSALPNVRAPTLLIVGGADPEVIRLNRSALQQLQCPSELVLVPHATHLFEEPGTLKEVSRLARAWLVHYLGEADQSPLG